MRRKVLGILTLLMLVFGVTGFFTAFEKPDAGTVIVVRNGGPFSARDVRTVIQPNSGLTWVGAMSKMHPYSANQRFYTISPNGDKGGIDIENTPTSDGVEVGVEGTIYLGLNTDPAALISFDDKYGTRTYKITKANGEIEYKYAWQDEEAWQTFLNQIVRPVISGGLRQAIGEVKCVDLQASCALIQNSSLKEAIEAVDATAKTKPGQTNIQIAKIQDRINARLTADFNTQLGGPFITDVRFSLTRITLPPKIQDAITSAQTAFASVTEAQAKIATAEAEATANAAKQRGYETCPACAQIDMLKAIPPNVTTYAPGSGFAITQPSQAAPAAK
ncbi:SPFH domain-containing protein [bacterium]|nr:MAG: SPFH domain-containing protein [bacterium]